MPMTLGELRSETLSWLDESSASTSSATYINVTNALKQAHTIRLTEDQWKFMLWPWVQTLTTVASQQLYSLHQEFLRPYWFRNTSQQQWLSEVPSRNMEPLGLDFANDTDTLQFALWGRSQVTAQPTSASVITIVSSSASDTTAAKAITIYGDTASGVTTESITPNGLTGVAGTTSFTQILGVTKGADWAGTLTMTSNSAAVTNLKLFPTEYGRSYQQMMLLGLPTANETITYRFYRKPRELSASNDLTDIPPPFERILVYDALLLMAAYDNRLDSGRQGLWRAYQAELDMQLRQSQLEGQSLGAQARYIMERSSGQTLRFPD